VGAGISLIGARSATRAEWRRFERQLEVEQLALLAKRRDHFEGEVRSAAVALSEAWAQIVRSHDTYRPEGQGEGDVDVRRSRLVEALTAFGLRVNTLLVLLISNELQAQVLEVGARLDKFRQSLIQPGGGLRERSLVPAALFELFRIVRKTDFLGS
jgi:hypothetical protein